MESWITIEDEVFVYDVKLSNYNINLIIDFLNEGRFKNATGN